MDVSADQNLMQSVPFWVGVFVVTALVGVCCTMSDSQEPEQDHAVKSSKKKNKNKKKKAEPAEPVAEVKEEAPTPSKKKAKQAQEPKKAPVVAAAPAKKADPQAGAPAWDSDESDVIIVKPSGKKGQPAKRQEVSKKQAPAAKDPKKKEEPVVVQKEQEPVNAVDSEDEWNEWNDIKDKKQVHKPKPVQQQTQGSAFGGMTSKGYLVAGPVAQPQNRFGGGDAWGNSGPSKPKHEVVNHASAVADYDFGVGRDVDSKFEKYSHICASSVAQARCDAKLSQSQLAQKVNDKTSTITELENCSGRYNADLVNRIEKALQVQIPRGRKGSSKK